MKELNELGTSAIASDEPRRTKQFTDRQKFFLLAVGFTSIAVFFLCLFRITTSSLIIHGGTNDPNTARLIAGQPRLIRADEWNRSTPDQLRVPRCRWKSNRLVTNEGRA